MSKKKKAALITVPAVAVIAVLAFLGWKAISYPGLYYKPISAAKMKTDKDYNLVAHRGLSCVAPENTLDSLQAAVDAGFRYIECDIQITKDNEWIVNHDTTIKRMTGEEGTIADMTAEEVQSYKITRGAHAKDYDAVSPTLEEFLAACQENDLIPLIELKEEGPDLPYDKVFDLLDQYGLRDKSVLISFHEDNLKACRKLDATIPMLYIINKPATEETLDIVRDLGVCGIDFRYSALKKSDEVVEQCREEGIPIGVWFSVESPRKAAKALEMGAVFITTSVIVPA